MREPVTTCRRCGDKSEEILCPHCVDATLANIIRPGTTVKRGKKIGEVVGKLPSYLMVMWSDEFHPRVESPAALEVVKYA